MTLSQEYLSAVSTMIIYGQDRTATMFNYYYYSGSTFTTNPPTGVTAILKNNGNIVAKLTGSQIALDISSVQFLFYDTSDNSYNFDEVDIYTENNGTLKYLVCKEIGLNYSKSSSEAVTIYFTLKLQNTPSLYINYSFLYLLVPGLSIQNIFPFRSYIGITGFNVYGVSGTVALIGTGLTVNGFVIILQLTTTGNGTPTINALTVSALQTFNVPEPTISPPTIKTDYVFSATLNVQLPQTQQQMTYPIEIGLTYEVE